MNKTTIPRVTVSVTKPAAAYAGYALALGPVAGSQVILVAADTDSLVSAAMLMGLGAIDQSGVKEVAIVGRDCLEVLL